MFRTRAEPQNSINGDKLRSFWGVASSGKKVNELVKVVQPAGRDRLGNFVPDFARYNDVVLFGEVWSRNAKLFFLL